MMRKTNRFLSLLLALILAMSLLPVTALAADDHGHDEISFTTPIGNDLGYITDTGEHYLCLTGNVTLSRTWVVQDGMTVYLCLNGHGIRTQGSGAVIQVNSGGKLYLYDCNESASTNYIQLSNYKGIRIVEDGSASTDIEDGTGTAAIIGGFITRGNNTSNDGVGVYVNGGTFEMHGGTIIGNNGGGVKVENSGTFTMSGGAIKYNKADNGGGVYFKGDEFKLSGGEISNNKAANSGDANGGGVCVEAGRFTMSDSAKITNNTVAAGDRNSSYGGGVYFNGNKFLLSGGTISGNNVSGNAGRGGGVYVKNGTFTMSGGEISGNIVSPSNTGNSGMGGGVYVYSGTFNMSGGEISGNTATNKNGSSGSGGGVYNFSKFNMSGGTISGNTAAVSGGGVYFNSGTFNMSVTASIKNNRAINGNGGGVYFGSNWGGCTFNVSGAPTVTDNYKGETGTTANNVYLVYNTYYEDNYKITVNGILEENASIGVTMGLAGKFTTGWNMKMGDAVPGESFFSDSSKYVVVRQGDEASLFDLKLPSANPDTTFSP